MTESAWVPKAADFQDSANVRHRGRDSNEALYRSEAAAYIADLTASLAVMARKHGLDALGFVLEMAKLEADNAVRHIDGSS